MADRHYPLHPKPAEDPRFNVGFLVDVAQLIERAGFPELTGRDHLELRQALYRFIYVGEEEK
jgi:hypothetical protein